MNAKLEKLIERGKELQLQVREAKRKKDWARVKLLDDKFILLTGELIELNNELTGGIKYKGSGAYE